ALADRFTTRVPGAPVGLYLVVAEGPGNASDARVIAIGPGLAAWMEGSRAHAWTASPATLIFYDATGKVLGGAPADGAGLASGPVGDAPPALVLAEGPDG